MIPDFSVKVVSFSEARRAAATSMAHSGGLNQPKQHLRIDDVVEGKLGIAILVGYSFVGAGTIASSQPAEPVLFLGLVPYSGIYSRFAGRQALDDADEFDNADPSFHALRTNTLQ